MPGIVSGALIAFTMSFDDFIISYFVTGGGVKNLSIMVYTMSKRVNPSINAISTLVVSIDNDSPGDYQCYTYDSGKEKGRRKHEKH